jgi:Flp pilus assembly protein TadD
VRAGTFLAKAVARSPMRPKAHFNYALLLQATKQSDKALVELRTASELDPEDAESHYLAGVIYLRLGRFEEAKAEFTESLRLKPTHADAKHNLALLEDLDRRYGAEHAGVGSQ